MGNEKHMTELEIKVWKQLEQLKRYCFNKRDQRKAEWKARKKNPSTIIACQLTDRIRFTYNFNPVHHPFKLTTDDSLHAFVDDEIFEKICQLIDSPYAKFDMTTIERWLLENI